MADPSPSIIPLVEAGADRSPFEPRLGRGFCLKIFLEASSMKPQDDQEPLIPPDASIGNPARAQPRLRGSDSSQQRSLRGKGRPVMATMGRPTMAVSLRHPRLRSRSPTWLCNSLHVCRMPCALTSSRQFARPLVEPQTCALSVSTSRSASAFQYLEIFACNARV